MGKRKRYSDEFKRSAVAPELGGPSPGGALRSAVFGASADSCYFVSWSKSYEKQ